VKRIRPAGITLAFASGLAAISVYVVCTAISWWLYPDSFGPLTHWLSYLGDPVRNPRGAAFYNAGCVLTGAALLLFVLGLGTWQREGARSKVLIAAQLVGLASAFFLVMLGFHSQERLQAHMYYSNRFFISFPVFITLLSSALYAHPHFKKGVAAVGFAVVATGLTFHGLFPVNRPMEWITELGFMAYVALVAWTTQKASPGSAYPRSSATSNVAE
jgi:uncharacterized protein DUF998